ncbi:MAG: LacI family DNA-binding transcriptional regulator [Roseibium sp.]|uniref:LacI family DNA-binding transcriptional regulator n=1 Tax=Roseibium sp. TaxID=1936156 RepID=UPI002606E685|nr:LacI family DNA-binding transcriptional regulator [Roseibium sp.]MCV0427937.1 LacI family DNA-binding transcriptional regulator [Roseibium sp.]
MGSETDKNRSPTNRRVTAADVAKVAGVSRSAVSRAFTEGAYLDKHKKKHILQVAEKLAYRPNLFAAGLQTKTSNVVAILAGQNRGIYDQELLDGLLSALLAEGKFPIVLKGNEIAETPSLQGIFGFPVDAMIVRAGSVEPFIVEACSKLNIPLIFSGCIVEADNIDCVACRNYEGMHQLVDMLIASGRRRFGYLDMVPNFAAKNQRPVAAEAALKEAGLQLMAHGTADPSFDGGLSIATDLLKNNDLDALVCANDEVALGALTAARDVLNISVPETLAITGFDNISMSGWPNYQLTTATNPIDETIATIVRLLLERLDNPEKPGERVQLGAELILRQTHS